MALGHDCKLCGDPIKTGGVRGRRLCARCYQRERRRKQRGEVEGPAGIFEHRSKPGTATRVTLRLSMELLERLELRARAENLDRVEWIRREIEVGLRRRQLREKTQGAAPDGLPDADGK